MPQQQSRRSTHGWQELCPTHKVETDAGLVTIRANTRMTGPRAGLRRIRSQNPDGTWTVVELGPDGRLAGIAHAQREKDAKAQLDAAARAARESAG
jgi:hypothetical protein